MKICKSIILSILLLAYSNLFAAEKILFAIDLIRHGDRTPTNELPKAPYRWKEGLGMLTEKGIQQEMSLGKAFRERYVQNAKLLPPTYHASTLYVYSTDFKRTQLSANSLLLGLYPPEDRIPPDETIPIHVTPNSQDYLLAVKPKSNILSKWKIYALWRKAWNERSPELVAKMTYWSEQTGFKLNNFQQAIILGDNIYIRQLHHVPLPPGITDADAKEILDLANWAVVKKFKIDDITYPMGHAFLQTVMNYFQNAISGKTPLKYVLFSAHDSSIMAVMNTLHAPMEKNPDYASDLNFSLLEDTGKYFVRVTLNNQPVKIVGCGADACTLAQFDKLVED